MISDLLPGYIEASLEDAQEQLNEVLVNRQPLRELLGLSDNLRMAGIGELFMTGRSTPLHKRLYQSSRAFTHGLAKLPEAERLGSRMRPFFDALAAEDTDAAADIARLSRRTWAQGKEYEEDFLFVEVMMQRFFVDPKVDAEALLTRWEKSLNGTEDLRLPMVRALLESDEPTFDSSLTAFLDDRSRALDERAAEDSIQGALLATEWHFCVEGVALVRLARQQGLSAASEYRHVPPAALQPARAHWQGSDWRVVGSSAAE